MDSQCIHNVGEPEKNEIGEDIAFCEETGRWMNVTLGECFGNCDGQQEPQRSWKDNFMDRFTQLN